MTKTYTKPDLIIHGNVEEITLNTGSTSDRDLIIFTGQNFGTLQSDGVGGSRDFQVDIDNGTSGFVFSDPND
ncbi:MAG: lasso peptide [Moorea sp. SIO3G5]|nr:lasso peptide [Moorena sp. SIO3G5]